MSRWLTPVMLLIAGLCVAAVITLKTCVGPRAGRDGFVLSLDPSGVNGIRIGNGGEIFELKRKGSGWQIEGGKLRDRADPAVVAELLKEAATLIYYDRISSGEVRSRDELSRFGLKSPKRWVEFEDHGRHKIFFGNESVVEGRIYALLEGSNDVFLVDDKLAGLVSAGLDKLRDLRLTDLASGQVDRVIVRREEGEMDIVRGPEGWRVVKPFSAAADETRVLEFLDSLLGLKISGFAGDDTGDLGVHGIEEGKSEIALYVEGRSRPLLLRFGARKGGEILAQFTPRDSVIRLPEATFDMVSAQPDQFRDRRLMPLNLDTIDLIRIGSPDSSFDLQRDGERWRVVASDGSRPASQAALQRMITALGETRVAQFLGQSPPTEPPVRTVSFFSILSENTPEARAGEHPVAGISLWPNGEGGVIAAIDGSGGTVVVQEDLPSAIPTGPSDWSLPVAP